MSGTLRSLKEWLWDSFIVHSRPSILGWLSKTEREDQDQPVKSSADPAVFEASGGDEINVTDLSPLVLAYIGDAVYELYIRQRLVARGVIRPKTLHAEAIRYVQASAQSKVLQALAPALTPEEMAVALRARNAHPGHLPRSASVADYHHSTAFEAVLGYLYLMQKKERLLHLMSKAEEVIRGD